MGQMMEIIALRGQVERKDAHIDKLQLDLDIAIKDKADSAELAVRLFKENQQLKRQLNDKQLEIEHCHSCCDELRLKINKQVGV